MWTLVTALVIVFFLSAFPVFKVEAGILSAVSYLFGGNNEYIEGLNNKSVQNMALLEAATNFDPNPAKGGGDIKIVDGVALASEGILSAELVQIDGGITNDQISIYVVREGDTLSQIAEMFGVSVNTIKWANDIKGEIQPGESLIILPVTGVKHIVSKGETLASIVKKYKADFDEVLQFNDLNKGSVLAIGDELIIPYVEMNTPSASTKTASTAKIYGAGGPNYDSYYSHPLPGSVITQGLHGYNAVDFGAPYGTPILASAGGKVIIVKDFGWNGGYGLYLVIEHDNGTQTLYSHESSITVSIGDYVEKGDVIGYVGSTGRSTGNHLHFEVRGAKNPFAK